MNAHTIRSVSLYLLLSFCMSVGSQQVLQTASAKAASTCLVQARKQTVAGKTVSESDEKALFVNACDQNSWSGSTSMQQASYANDTVDGLQGLFLHPPSQFAFCFIPKNGCTSWTQILHKLYYDDITVNKVDYDIASLSLHEYGLENATQVFNDPKAVRAVMIREPLARFASAFLDKCIRDNCTDKICIWRKTNTSISFKTAVEGMLATDQRDLGDLNPHWSPQSDHCGLKKHLREYNLVVFETKDTYSTDAACMLDRAGLSRLDYYNETQKFWNRTHALKKDDVSNAGEDELLKRLFTKEAARKLIAHLQEEYRTFNLSEPAWVAEATGELYNAYDTGCDGEVYGTSSTVL